jgi:hypothetical protein
VPNNFPCVRAAERFKQNASAVLVQGLDNTVRRSLRSRVRLLPFLFPTESIRQSPRSPASRPGAFPLLSFLLPLLLRYVDNVFDDIVGSDLSGFSARDDRLDHLGRSALGGKPVNGCRLEKRHAVVFALGELGGAYTARPSGY